MDNCLKVNSQMKLDKDQIWTDVLSSLRVQVSEPTYNTWISKTHLVSLKKTDKTRYLAEIGCNSGMVKTHIETRYLGLTQETIMKTISAPCEIKFVVKQKIVDSVVDSSTPLFEERDMTEEIVAKIESSRIRLNFKFETFAVSSSNQLAHAAAEAVAEQPGRAYNPLVIWGGVGVGKTHLMHAIGHKMINRDINKRILACTGEDFTNDIVEGIRNKTTHAVRAKYRKLHGLFVDDIQFIAGKDTVMEEFFHTFNAVTSNGGQVVVTSDKPPHEIPKLEARLRSRFEAGMITDIAQPDYELRLAIVQIKAQERGLTISDTDLAMIAGNIQEARQIEGFLMKLSTQARMNGVETNQELIAKLINKGAGKDEAEEERLRKVPADKVIEKICEYYQVGKRSLLGKGRTKDVVKPRQILMYILRTHLQLSLEEVGRVTGGRDHSTVMHNVDKVTLLSSSNVDISGDILRIKNML